MGIFLGWLAFSFFVGLIGGERKIGFWGAFMLSLFLSPIIGLIATVLSKSNEDAKREAQMLALQQQQAAALASLQQSATPAAAESALVLPADPDARAARLKDLRDRGIITQEEFLTLIAS
ncbi:MAG: SHOCT domain-containing protein [Janthinobacterium lividum]